ncbi:winged helix-turn-helix domain-containing protein [Streptomyces sp. NPDC057694]|uniref:winged helix-turn-helix domain-containing protein n=1 Tax=Streptomyces sp. NPDC057694 TaxID=3346216 RepID=UPI0036B41EFD
MSFESTPPDPTPDQTPDQTPDPRTRVLRDPSAIRALAHPLRVELYALIGRTGPLTSAEAGRELGISQALASHHIRQLARHGFLTRAPGRNNREHPWQAASHSMSWRGAGSTQEGAAAADLLEQVFLESAVNRYLAWQQARGGSEPGWRDTAGVGFNSVYLTTEELEGLVGAIDALIKPYVEARPIDDPATRPEGSRLVDLTYLVSVEPPSADADEPPEG